MATTIVDPVARIEGHLKVSTGDMMEDVDNRCKTDR